jgi:Uri superfamily endonuclease
VALKGTYLLLLQLDADLPDLQVGRLGRCRFAAGYYLYVGSAHGPGGIPARLAHHERRVKARPHWHIDYLRPHARLLEAWSIGSRARIECPLVRALVDLAGLRYAVRGFGSSDSDCPCHLLYLPRRPGLCLLTQTLLATVPLDQAQGHTLTLDIKTYEESRL